MNCSLSNTVFYDLSLVSIFWILSSPLGGVRYSIHFQSNELNRQCRSFENQFYLVDPSQKNATANHDAVLMRGAHNLKEIQSMKRLDLSSYSLNEKHVVEKAVIKTRK